MTRLEYWTLSVVALALSLMLIGNYYLTVSNNSSNAQLARDQAAINNAEQLKPVLDQLTKRIAKGSENDPRLAEVLKRNGLQVILP
jgi:cytochrome c-type biogenesis protein CcmH/NrfG